MSHFRFRTSAFAAIVIAGMVFALGRGAGAVKMDTYPATGCVKKLGWSFDNDRGRLVNVGSIELSIECPIVRRNEYMFLRAEVWVIDQHPSEPVMCTHWIERLDTAQPEGQWFVRGTQGYGSSPIYLDLNYPALVQEASVNVITCDLPGNYGGGKSALVGYRAWYDGYKSW